MKRILSLILTLILIVSCVPAVFAADSREIDGISISGTNRLFLTVNYSDGTEMTAEVTDFIESEEQPQDNIDHIEGDFVTERGTFHGIIRFDVSDTGIQRFANGVELKIGDAVSNKLDRNLFLLLQKIKKELVPAVITEIVEGRIEGGQSSSFEDCVLARLACGMIGKYAWISEGEDENGCYRIYDADVVIEAVETLTDARDFSVFYPGGYDEKTGTLKIYFPTNFDLKGNVKIKRDPDWEGATVVFTSLEKPQYYSGYYSYFTYFEIGVRPDGRVCDVWQRDDFNRGDVNTDYTVDLKDLLLLRKLLAGEADLTMVDVDQADFDGNGKVNMKDVLMLRKYLAGELYS